MFDSPLFHRTLFVTGLLVALSASAWAQVQDFAPLPHEEPYYGRTITEIWVEGNTKTERDTVLLIGDIEEGDTFVERTSYDVTLALVNSGLFKEVKVSPSKDEDGQGVKLVVIAKDKHSWVIGPTFYNEPGNVGGGLGFGEANLWGQNKKLLLYAQVATADSLFIAVFQDPAIKGTRLSHEPMLFLRREKVTEYTNPNDFFSQPVPQRISTMHYLNAGWRLGLRLWGGFSLGTRLRGAYVFYDDAHLDEVYAERNPTEPEPVNPQEDGFDVSYEASLMRDKMANWHGVKTGTTFKLQWEKAIPELGSDVDYWRAGVNLDVGLKFFDTHNLLVKSSFWTGKTLPFQQELTAGGGNLRGYINRQFRGDTKFGAQSEYSLKLFSLGPFTFRGLAFWDTAFTGFFRAEGNEQRHYLVGQTENKLNKWRNGVGGGFRVYIKSIVLPLLGLDWGYGIEANEYHIYFALGVLDG